MIDVITQAVFQGAADSPVKVDRDIEQPHTTDIYMADGVFIKQIVVPKAMTLIPQHSHTYDHTSMVAKGRILVWQDDVYIGSFEAPKGIIIKANCKHTILATEADTIFYCIHNVSRTGHIDIAEEHSLGV